MDWITGIQRALDYIENHLTDEIDYKTIANQAYSSSFHFQRMFSMLCGYSIGDYIRMRRMTLAAEELKKNDPKDYKTVIDIALKFGYNTPESFSRAFTRFHGITPTEARQGGNIRSFSRLSVKLILTGGITMDYRIERRDAFKVVCRRKQVRKEDSDTATIDISAFWNECNRNGTMQKICKYGKFDNMKGVLGICFADNMSDSSFPYGIGAEYNGLALTDTEIEVINIPAYTYAVFPCRGQMPDAFIETYKKICTEFFPQNSTYEYGSGIELEVYPSNNVKDIDYTCEIWIAVNEK